MVLNQKEYLINNKFKCTEKTHRVCKQNSPKEIQISLNCSRLESPNGNEWKVTFIT